MKYFVLQLSFLGWYILTGITCGLLSLYVVPYFSATEVQFYNDVKSAYNTLNS